jgi:tetratricopeptide (TPR) repeat protein/transcriptional regulator with XRE-family HTH domain
MEDRPDRKPNWKLRGARERRGWSRLDLVVEMQRLEVRLDGADLGLDSKLIERWERGDVTPRRFYQARLCLVFQLPPEGLGFAPLPTLLDEFDRLQHRLQVRGVGETLTRLDPQEASAPVVLDFSAPPRHTVDLVARFTVGDLASRRDVLRAMAVLGGATLLRPVSQWAAAIGSVVGLEPIRSSGDDDVAELENAVRVFRRWDDQNGGGLHRKAVIGQLRAVAELLEGSHPPELKRRLFRLTAELAQVAGWMTYDSGMPGVAQRYYLLSLRACREAGDPALGAKVVGDLADLSHTLGRHDDELELLRTAIRSLGAQRLGNNYSELLGLEGRAYAELGQATNARTAIDASVEAFGEAADEPLPDWCHYLTVASVAGLATDTYIELASRTNTSKEAAAYAAIAEQHAMRATSLRGELFVRSRVFDAIRLAMIRIGQNEPGAALAEAENALHLADNVRSTLVVDDLMRFNSRLSSYASVPGARQFQLQLRAYLAERSM